MYIHGGMVRQLLVKTSAERVAMVAGVLSGAATTALLATTLVSAFRSGFERKAVISVGARFNVTNLRFGLSEDFGEMPKVALPQVSAVSIEAPRVAYRRMSEQTFAINVSLVDFERADKVSAFEKSQRITLANTDELEDGEETAFDRQALLALITSSFSIGRTLNNHLIENDLAIQEQSDEELDRLHVSTQVVSGRQREGSASLVAAADFGATDKKTGYSDAGSLSGVKPDMVRFSKPTSGLPENGTSQPLSASKMITQPSAFDTAYEKSAMTLAASGNLYRSRSMDIQESRAVAAAIDVKEFMKSSMGMQSITLSNRGPAGVMAYYQPTTSSPNVGSDIQSVGRVNTQTQQQDQVVGPTGAGQFPRPEEKKPEGKVELSRKESVKVNDVLETQRESRFGGHVTEAFSGGEKIVENALVQILGTPWSTKTDSSGSFVFDKIKVAGVLPVIITKDGYLKRRVDLKENALVDIELVTENVEIGSAVAAGVSKGNDGAFLFGQLTSSRDEVIEAMKVEIEGPGKAAPVYLDVNGAPNSKLTSTTSRGQFMFLNLQPGTYLVTIIDALGLERAPHVVHVSAREGLVRKFSLGEQRIIQGRILNAAANDAPVGSAGVQLVGNRKQVVTDASGRFTLGPLYVDCSAANYLQVEKSGYYRNRIDYGCNDTSTNQGYYVFPASHVDGLANEAQADLKSVSAAIIGHVGFNQSVKMQLWGPEEMNLESNARGKDFYFDTDGVLNISRNRTSSNGNFAILDAPEGISYIQAFSKDNRTLSFWPVFLSPSTLNVYAQ